MPPLINKDFNSGRTESLKVSSPGYLKAHASTPPQQDRNRNHGFLLQAMVIECSMENGPV